MDKQECIENISLICPFCEEIATYLKNDFNAEHEMYNFLIVDESLIEDFILMPDQRPLSELHLLLISKAHILSMSQYLCSKKTILNLEKIITQIEEFVYERFKKHIIVLEHGSKSENSKFSGKSIDHMHLHILLKRDTNIEDIILKDKNKVVDTSGQGSKCSFRNLKELSKFKKMKIEDYFLVWIPSQKAKQFNIYFPVQKESQFLRRMYFSSLTTEEKIAFGLTLPTEKKSYKNGYNWKMYGTNFSSHSKCEYINLGMELATFLHERKKY